MPDDSKPSLAARAARLMRRAEPPASSPAVDPRQRAAHIALLTATIREERSRAARRRWATASLAAAACLAAALGVRALLARPPAIVVSGPPSPSPYALHVEGDVRPAASLHVGDRVHARDATTRVVVATGTKLTLDPAAEIAVVEEGPTQIFSLGAGSVRADVAKLREGERFLVRTADVEVEVRGTSFRVESLRAAPECMPVGRTRVVVVEGVVVVRHAGVEAQVRAGETWPPPCPAAETRSASAAPPAQSASAAAATASPGSTLAVANALFGRAEAARKSGDGRGVVALFDRLLAEYPASPLIESATVERMRALDGIDRSRAVAAARDYLARFPRGFARAEAESILAIGP